MNTISSMLPYLGMIVACGLLFGALWQFALPQSTRSLAYREIGTRNEQLMFIWLVAGALLFAICLDFAGWGGVHVREFFAGK